MKTAKGGAPAMERPGRVVGTCLKLVLNGHLDQTGALVSGNRTEGSLRIYGRQVKSGREDG